jgi:hypothetical protein
MILVDTGPLIALFDPQDPYHQQCVEILKSIQEPLMTSLPVLTEAFHLLTPGSKASKNLSQFILKGGLRLFFMDIDRLRRALALMDTYADHPMDLADASLVAAAEFSGTNKVFTVDRNDFATYRISKGHSFRTFEILG